MEHWIGCNSVLYQIQKILNYTISLSWVHRIHKFTTMTCLNPSTNSNGPNSQIKDFTNYGRTLTPRNYVKHINSTTYQKNRTLNTIGSGTTSRLQIILCKSGTLILSKTLLCVIMGKRMCLRSLFLWSWRKCMISRIMMGTRFSDLPTEPSIRWRPFTAPSFPTRT